MNGQRAASPVIFGEEDDSLLFGTVSLEALGHPGFHEAPASTSTDGAWIGKRHEAEAVSRVSADQMNYSRRYPPACASQLIGFVGLATLPYPQIHLSFGHNSLLS